MNWKHLIHHETNKRTNKKNATKNIQDFWAAWTLYQTRLGQHSSHRNPAVSLLRFQMLLEEHGILHSGKHGPFPTFLTCCSKWRNTFFFKKRIHLICPIFNLLWLKYGSVTFANQFFIYICLHSVPTVVIWICTYLADTVNQNVGDWLSRRNLCLALFFSCLVCLTDS